MAKKDEEKNESVDVAVPTKEEEQEAEQKLLPPIKTVEQLEDKVREFLVLEDPYIVRILCAAVLANQLDGDVVWLMLNAPPAGGKSEFIQALFDLECTYAISSLTPRTFISGVTSADGKEPSLLDRLHGKIMLFKDFTTVIEMSSDNRREIMSQMREIFDGDFRKDFGNGKQFRWVGRAGAIAAITPGGARILEESTQMGERFIQYKIIQPDRLAVLAKGHDNRKKNIRKMRDEFKENFNRFLEDKLQAIDNFEVEYDLPDELVHKLSHIADLSTRARSAVQMNVRTGEIDFVPTKEMPTRFLGQIIAIATGFFVMNGKNELTEKDFLALCKIGLDSIPDHRLIILKELVKYKAAATGSLAAEVQYPTATVRGWLNELAGLGIIKRYRHPVKYTDMWRFKTKADRELLAEMLGTTMTEEDLMTEDDGYDDDDNKPTYVADVASITKEVSDMGLDDVDSIEAADNDGKIDAIFKDF